MNVANVLKNPATHWAATRWRLRLLVGRVTSFVPVPRTQYALGVFGQSPLPEKDPHDFGGRTMATALFGRARSVASRDLLGLPDAQA
jgi:hypothetical protein